MPNPNKLLWLPLPLAIMLSAGCSSLAPRHEQAVTAPQPAAVTEEAPSDTLPHVELTSNLLYSLLVAGFAGESGEPHLSAEAYFKAAQQTRDPRLAKDATRMAMYGGDTKLAFAAANLWSDIAPNDPEATQAMAGVLISDGRTADARPYLEKVITQNQQGYLIAASLLERDSDKTRALTMMKALIAPHQQEGDAQFAYASLAAQQGNNELALQSLDQLLKDHPDHLQGLILEARLLHAMGRKDEAVKALAKAVKQVPDNSQLRLVYARMLVDDQRLKEARKEFRTINRQNPEDPDVIYALGLLALQANDVDDAEQQFLELLKLQQRESEANFALAQIAESRNQLDKAIDYYKAVDEGENALDAQLHAAVLIAKQEGVDKAREFLHSLQPDNGPDTVRITLLEGELLREAERYDDAMGVYNDALALFPDNAELLYARAMMAERVDRLDILEQDLRAILDKNPNNAQALNALGYTLADRTNRYQEAKQLIEKALQLAPNDPAILDSMGWVLYRMGEKDKAIGYLKQALAKQFDGEIAAHLGEVLWVSGQHKEADEVWKDALKKAPDNKLLRQTVERFDK